MSQIFLVDILLQSFFWVFILWVVGTHPAEPLEQSAHNELTFVIPLVQLPTLRDGCLFILGFGLVLYRIFGKRYLDMGGWAETTREALNDRCMAHGVIDLPEKGSKFGRRQHGFYGFWTHKSS